jgi:hypothetical protein
MPDYLVEIQRTNTQTRTYAIKAASPEKALAKLARDPYHKDVEFVEDDDDGNDTLHGDTAVVYADDDTRKGAVLLDVASDVFGKE